MIKANNNILYSLFHTFFPRRCLLCNNILKEDEQTICSHCDKLSSYPTNINIGDFFAPLSLYIENICILYYYTYAKESIQQFKFNENIYKGKLLANLLCEKLSTQIWINDIDLIVPIPLHKKKTRKRGFNQSNIISQTIATYFHKKNLTNNLIRIINTKDQHTSTINERYENIRNAFRVKDPTLFDNKNILLVDDVITTCSTIGETCKEILKSKNVKIYIACLASDRLII